ncbi:MAG: aminotransferase class III-fold pyridoxal phosphate-dependent enzyme [Gammaproteobacteria bacterium]|nr:aminotransferase class III-fold pyridoxal phosphate-dependent enzyme [Gammaproteobacteria bacterium]
MDNVLNCSGHDLKIPNIVDSEGVYLFDENGKQYMDLESGVWCTALGHKNSRINKVINSQIKSIMHAGFCYSSEILDEAAKAILSITDLPGGKCVFLCSGSEAIEILRQISRHVMGRTRTLVLHDAYLGSYSAVINRNEDWHIFDWRKCETCPKQNECDPGCDKLQSIPGDITEFLLEPGSASGFVRFPPRAMIRNMVDIVRNNNGKVIANEVTTGTGRTGKWFGYQHYDMEPDMISIGKGIGNGYPVSVAVLSSALVKELEEKPFKYSQSHQNDPLGAAVVREVIQVIDDDNLVSEAEKKGKYFLSQLNRLVDNKIVLGVRGKGLMFAVDLVNEQLGDEVFDELIEQGFIVCNRGSLFRIDPPLTISDEEFGKFIDAFCAILASKKNFLS